MFKCECAATVLSWCSDLRVLGLLAGMPAQTQRLHTTTGWRMVLWEEYYSFTAILVFEAIGIQSNQADRILHDEREGYIGGFCKVSLDWKRSEQPKRELVRKAGRTPCVAGF